ncbi:helix-turn-helix domain-containing protein [Streptomyces sp. RLB3-6]|uniref:helix-turn-helix domain-containing protein n=1 Tax=Streptomyces sp. RLB3-6 TaxID=2594457 RepID=UPI001164C9DC|nr:helix-turn-helix domain-containing protein [Streptomyces sp. RLB3-6]QDN84408.1 helix-turn-helix domain-containing protein [Streptomyces sp. RLB3-6]
MSGPATPRGEVHDVDAWRGALRETLVKLDAIPIGNTGGDAEYTGWAHQLDLGYLTVTDVGSDPVRVVRTPKMLTGPQDDYFMLSIAQEDSAVNTTVDSRLRQGDAVLLDSTVPFQLRADGRAHHLVLTLPRADVRRVMSIDRERIGRRIDAQNPMLAVLQAAVREIYAGEDRFDPRLLPELGHTLRELTLSVLRSAEHADQAGVNALLGHRAQLRNMQDFIQHHLAEPDLSATTLAAAFDVSERYVQIVFRESGTSPARYIREVRMETARRVLADPGQRHRTIEAIARSVGIVRAEVFTRIFRQFYDITPSEYRRS